MILAEFLSRFSSMADEEQEYYGYYYGDDEDRGLLDTAWENQQKKVWVRTASRCVHYIYYY